MPRKSLPVDFEANVEKLLEEISSVDGYLGPNEIRFLALLAAFPTATGEILEIGSFKGKSTIVLAKSAPDDQKIKVHAVDPLTAPSITDPDLNDDASSFQHFKTNTENFGVADSISLHQKFSYELATEWNSPIRLLWIDGDHTYQGTKRDFDGFAKFVEDGGIIAIHDVLHEFEGGLRVFMEDVLLSPNFGACGFVGSIAWAQFHRDPTAGVKFQKQKMMLYKRLSRLVPFVVFNKRLKGLEKKIYKLYRSRIPRSAVRPKDWIKLID